MNLNIEFNILIIDLIISDQLRHLPRNSDDGHGADGDDLNVDDLRMPRQWEFHLDTHKHTCMSTCSHLVD